MVVSNKYLDLFLLPLGPPRHTVGKEGFSSSSSSSSSFSFLLHPGCSPFLALALLDLGKARLHQAEQNSDKRPPPAAFNAVCISSLS